MGRLPLVDPDDESAPESVRAVLRAMRETTGRDFNVIRATANHPAIFEAFLTFSSAAYVGNSLDPATRELAYLSASLANDCHYWVPTHIVLGRSTGLGEEKLVHLLDDPLPVDVYDAAERVAIVYARRSTRLEPIDDELYAELERHYPTQQIMELCFTVGLSNVVNRFHATFHTDLDEETADEFRDGSPLPLPRLDGEPDRKLP